ncbi:RNA polymerase sigma factor SigY [Gorillibacterium sp. CAU 1737]|uniref:RNA polymerase sigma factor SigY n=1 Tax=Gorillibacterium sp. CAU 1737 TaxID=3140362 RepID=UPI0032609651
MDLERQLMERAQGGDMDALAELLQEHYRFLYHYLLKITLNPDKAQDFTQDTLLRSVEKIHTFDGRSKFSTWLITIATRLVIDADRKRKREWRFLQRQAKEQEDSSRLLRWRLESQGAEWTDVLEGLSTLKEEQRFAVVLRHYYGYSQQEIAAITGVPEGTVKSRVHLGLKSLRKELTTHDEES